MQISAQEAGAERLWWLYTLAVLQSPRAVFAALRDESPAAVDARREPVSALVLLGGVAGVLIGASLSELDLLGVARDGVRRDGLTVAALLLLGGMLNGLAAYWVGGAVLYAGLRGAGSPGGYRRARQMLALAGAPLVLALVAVWPIQLAIYGGDLFQLGGSDTGSAGTYAFRALYAAAAVWAFSLLVTAVSTVEGWRVVRALGAVALAAFALLALALLPLMA